MEDANLWLFLLIITLPFIGLLFGWVAARIDIRSVVRQAKAVPDNFYASLDALVDGNTGLAAAGLAEAAEQQKDKTPELDIILAKLYRRRGEHDKAIRILHTLAEAPEHAAGRHLPVIRYELGLSYQAAGLVDRAEAVFLSLQHTDKGDDARRHLLAIYQQDRDWEKAVATAEELSSEQESYQILIAQFHCEIAQSALNRANRETARRHIQTALAANSRCCRANIILGDLEQKLGNHAAAAEAYCAVEKQNAAYLGMTGRRIYDAYAAQGRAEEGLALLSGYLSAMPELNLADLIGEKTLELYGEAQAAAAAAEQMRSKPDLAGAYRLLGARQYSLPPAQKADADIIRTVIARQLQNSRAYRCRHCHFKSQVFFWHCPACNKWETFPPNPVET